MKPRKPILLNADANGRIDDDDTMKCDSILVENSCLKKKFLYFFANFRSHPYHW